MLGDLSQELSLIVSGGVHVGAYFPGTVADTGRLVARGQDVAADTELVVEPGEPVALTLPPVWDLQRFDDSGEIRLTLVATLRDRFGNLVRDGTVVEFRPSVGTVNPPSALTVDGRATSEFVLSEITFAPVNVWVTSPGSAAFNWIDIPVLMPRLFIPTLYAR
jgi:hypothetical protein